MRRMPRHKAETAFPAIPSLRAGNFSPPPHYPAIVTVPKANLDGSGHGVSWNRTQLAGEDARKADVPKPVENISQRSTSVAPNRQLKISDCV